MVAATGKVSFPALSSMIRCHHLPHQRLTQREVPSWSDCDGVLSRRFSDDFVLTQASLYWFTNTISTSFRPYYEHARGMREPVEAVRVPTALAVFPHDLSRPPRSWAERSYKLTRYTAMPRGGHFAAHEEPELLGND